MASPNQSIDQFRSFICDKVYPKASVPLYRIITQLLPKQSDSCSFWWRSSGFALATLLEKAGVTPENHVHSLLFYYLHIIPYLGRAPIDTTNQHGIPLWKSFMTDDHTPVELSWSWGDGCEASVIRFSFEPIGPGAGTDADPLNADAAFDLMNGLRQVLPNLDFKWFDHFSKNLLSYKDVPIKSEEGPGGNKSRVFLAFDLHEGRITPKAYFFPTFKAICMAQSTMDVIADAIKSLPNNQKVDFSSFDTLHGFVRESQVEVDMLAIDCVEAAAARLKVYIRNRSTSWNSVRHMVTLGGLIDNTSINKGLKDLYLLWTILYNLEDELPPDQDLAYKDHRTAGILYNFELRPGSSTIVPKVYIPVRHYVRSDSRIMQRLKLYLHIQRSTSPAEKYIEAMKQIL